jgi:hypothetical protein
MILRCLQTWAPLRREPSSASEMVSSLLFGETCTLQYHEKDWLYVACTFDGYEGWIPNTYLEPVEGPAHEWSTIVSGHRTALIHNDNRIHLSLGSQLPAEGSISIRGVEWQVEDISEVKASQPWEWAKTLLHVPYLWGGRSDCGIDCSGLAQVAYKCMGLQLPRDSKDQALSGELISFGNHAPNDLAFFNNADGKITHVGVISPAGIIHASAWVKEETLTEAGIVNTNSGSISHTLYSIRRII